MFKQKNFIKTRSAIHTPCVLVDAVHAAKPNHDMYTGEIAERVSEIIGCHCIVATVSRNVADLNRPPNRSNAEAVAEYRESINQLLETSGMIEAGALVGPFLHLAIHGIADRPDKDIELGTCCGSSCSTEIRDWIMQGFEKSFSGVLWQSRKPRIGIDEYFIGDTSKSYHRSGDPGTEYAGYGRNFNTVQVEIAKWLRRDHRGKVIYALCRTIEQFINEFQS